MSTFDHSGMLIIPVTDREPGKQRHGDVQYVVTEAYCPKGCSIIDAAHPINGFSGLRMKFRRPGAEGEFVISAIGGDFTKTILAGRLEDGVKDELLCPHCDTPFQKLVYCHCHAEGDMVVIGLTPHLDFNNAVTFCNVKGCSNGSFVKSGEVLRLVGTGEWL